MDKSSFEEMYNILADKYKFVEKSIPFVGNKFVSFASGENFINLVSPHMSFDLNVIYVTKSHYKKFKQNRQADEKNELEKKKAVL